jgi:HEAT repeat protein
MAPVARLLQGLRARARATYRRRPRIYQMLGLVVLVLVAPRLLGEYYYLRIVLTDDSGVVVSNFGHLERMWWGGTGPLIRLLSSNDVSNRDIAASCLSHHKGRAVVSALMNAARSDADPPVQIAAVNALGTIGDAQAVPTLKELGSTIASGAPAIRPEFVDSFGAAITKALASMGEPGKQALLGFAGGSRDIRWRAYTLMAACSFKDDVAVRQEGKRAIADASWQMREAGTSCVQLTIGRTGIDLLKPLLEDPDLHVRIAAARALAALKDTSGLSAMKAIVLDDSVERVLRSQALTVVGDIGDTDAVTFLCGFAATEPNGRLQEDAKISASRLRPDLVAPCSGAIGAR